MTKRTVYSVAFKDEKFLMVYHPKRKGWEMPGGSVENSETVEDAAKREFLEESGYCIEVVRTRDLGPCDVCACRLLNKVTDECEMVSELFTEIPSELSFDRSEYEETIPWARSILKE